MDFSNNNDKLQEAALVVGEGVRTLNKAWLYLLGLVVVMSVPTYFVLKFSLTSLFLASYQPPEITYQPSIKEPLSVIDKKIFKLDNRTYSGYVRIKNINLDWGVSNQNYTAEFRSSGDSLLATFAGKTFVLPSSEKIIVFPRFEADKEPTEISFVLAESMFQRKTITFGTINLSIQRTSLDMVNGQFVVSSAVTNSSAFTIKQVSLPVVLYNNNQVVGANFTNINDVKSGETRTFQYVWPKEINANRADITPEVNIFDREVLKTQEGKSPFDDLQEDKDFY